MYAEHLLSLTPMLALLIWAAVEDLRSRRIPNWLTLCLAAGGLFSGLLGYLPVSAAQSGLGLVIGFAIPFVLFAVGALGGGDVKLIAGLGAWLGPVAVIGIFMGAAIFGLFIVLIQCAYQGKLFLLFRNSTVLAMTLLHVNQLGVKHASETGQACRTVDRPLPYAVPVLLATLVVVFCYH